MMRSGTRSAGGRLCIPRARNGCDPLKVKSPDWLREYDAIASKNPSHCEWSGTPGWSCHHLAVEPMSIVSMRSDILTSLKSRGCQQILQRGIGTANPFCEDVACDAVARARERSWHGSRDKVTTKVCARGCGYFPPQYAQKWMRA
jgi:hypothetical protein